MHARSIVTLVTLLGAGAALAQATPSATPEPAVVLGELHGVNALEVELGNLAQGNGGQAEVKRYGQHLVKAHTAMDAKGAAFAKKQHLTIKAPPRDAAHQAEATKHAGLKEKLRTLKGADFDRAYVQAMADGHGEVLEKIKSWQAGTQDSALKGFLDDASKEVAEHQRQAEELLAKLGKTAAR